VLAAPITKRNSRKPLFKGGVNMSKEELKKEYGI